MIAFYNNYVRVSQMIQNTTCLDFLIWEQYSLRTLLCVEVILHMKERCCFQMGTVTFSLSIILDVASIVYFSSPYQIIHFIFTFSLWSVQEIRSVTLVLVKSQSLKTCKHCFPVYTPHPSTLTKPLEDISAYFQNPCCQTVNYIKIATNHIQEANNNVCLRSCAFFKYHAMDMMPNQFSFFAFN